MFAYAIIKRYLFFITNNDTKQKYTNNAKISILNFTLRRLKFHFKVMRILERQFHTLTTNMKTDNKFLDIDASIDFCVQNS